MFLHVLITLRIGYFPSALHRVGLPPLREGDDATVTKARYATIYFYAPDNEAVIEPLRTCITEDRPAEYEPVEFAKYGEWLSKHMYGKGDSL
jgi:isopenicillin N synthase-like dioxygenase